LSSKQKQINIIYKGTILGNAKNPYPVKLFLAIMYCDEGIRQKALDAWIERFGNIEFSYGPVTVSIYTEYYGDEMGPDIKKCFYTFTKLIDRSQLPEIKTISNTFEVEQSADGKRVVNLDPGYISTDKLVLATTKDFYHRIYLGNGIYGEVTLHFRHGKFRYFSWTYPDYKEEAGVLKLLTLSRAKLVYTIRNMEKQ